MTFKRDLQTTAQTDTSLVAAPGAGKQIVVHAVGVATAAANVVKFESGNSSLRWQFELAANSNQYLDAGAEEIFRCAENEALTYTTSAASGNQFVSVRYSIVRSTGA